MDKERTDGQRTNGQRTDGEITGVERTDGQRTDGEITDVETFDALLAQLVEAATSNDVEIQGSREYRDETEGRDLEVMIFALSVNDPPE